MKPLRHVDGAAAESLAEAYLRRQDLRILERNYRCRLGEIDIIAQEDAGFVFVEVRLRRSTAFGGAAASVDRRKQQRIMHAAQHFLQRRGPAPCRFDVILLDGLSTDRIEWLRDAFGE